MISILGTGTDNVDLEEARRRGIVVSNTPAINHVAVAELCIGLLLATWRNLSAGDRWLRQGLWWHPPTAHEIRGKTLGLLGPGAIGTEMARLGRGIGMNVIAWSPTHDAARAVRLGVALVERDEIFRRSDAVSLHLRNTPQSRGSVGRREFELMKPSAILINTARAGIINQDDLVAALKSSRIAGQDSTCTRWNRCRSNRIHTPHSTTSSLPRTWGHQARVEFTFAQDAGRQHHRLDRRAARARGEPVSRRRLRHWHRHGIGRYPCLPNRNAALTSNKAHPSAQGGIRQPVRGFQFLIMARAFSSCFGWSCFSASARISCASICSAPINADAEMLDQTKAYSGFDLMPIPLWYMRASAIWACAWP
jgi:hypothetical protein